MHRVEIVFYTASMSLVFGVLIFKNHVGYKKRIFNCRRSKKIVDVSHIKVFQCQECHGLMHVVIKKYEKDENFLEQCPSCGQWYEIYFRPSDEPMVYAKKVKKQ